MFKLPCLQDLVAHVTARDWHLFAQYQCYRWRLRCRSSESEQLLANLLVHRVRERLE